MKNRLIERSVVSGYPWKDAELFSAHKYLLPVLLRVLEELPSAPSSTARKVRLFDLGCGNGSVAHILTQKGWDVIGVDPSTEGIAKAHECYPDLSLYQGSAYDDLAEKYGCFPVVTSIEVVEHLYFPRRWALTLFALLEPGGTAIVSAPYHGYWKNLTLALTGKLDAHFTALQDHGHIKFWSIRTLGKLLREAGFVNIRFKRVGRIPPLAKSMIAVARKP